MMNALFGGLFSILGRLIRGGCFVADTPVTVSEWPSLVELRNSNSSTRSWSGESGRSGTLVQRKVAIESLSIGSRVPTKNPNRWEVAPQAEPDPATWAKLSITVERSDGGVIDAELIRPRSWMEAYDLRAGRTMRLNLPELEVSGVATITAISACPPIATGEGSVITARFMTRQVDEVTSVEILGADGATETITGTSIHPVWSVDRQVWVPLAELSEGETLQGSVGPAIVLSVSLSRVSQPVYNVEVHNEHVYQVGEIGVLVHNSCFDDAPSVNGPGVVTLRNRGAFQGMNLTGETRSGLNRASAEWRELYGPAAMRRHHLAPQEMTRNRGFMDRMNALGYTDEEAIAFVNRQISDLPNVQHMQIHAEGWNPIWREWLRRNPNFDVSDIRAQVQSMMREFELPRSSLGGPQHGR
jgi:hypothetical protein